LKRVEQGSRSHHKNTATAGDGAGETSRTTNYELHNMGWATAPTMLGRHGHVPVPICTISIWWNFHTTPYQSSETTS
jgi:hypothetical protein